MGVSLCIIADLFNNGPYTGVRRLLDVILNYKLKVRAGLTVSRLRRHSLKEGRHTFVRRASSRWLTLLHETRMHSQTDRRRQQLLQGLEAREKPAS